MENSLEIKKNSINNIYEFSFNKKVDNEVLNLFYQQIEEKSKVEKKLKILGVLKETPNLKDFNIFKEAILSKAEAFHNNIKYAILTDQEWMFKLVSVTEFFTPNITLKVFYLKKKQTALMWLKNE